MAANGSTTLQILDNLGGDCTEHTLLFVSLARAVGIPAREVGGLAYPDIGRPVFGWHAWAEIHDGRQWVSVDPTWGEFYVDATHIKFQEGSDDFAWMNVAGKIKLRVLRLTTDN
jgi:transglutaminase-like putative cysteine protease